MGQTFSFNESFLTKACKANYCSANDALRVALISLCMSRNLGERLVIKCSEYLMRRVTPEEAFEFTECDLYARVRPTAKLYTPGKNSAFGCSKDLSRLDRLVCRMFQKGRRSARGQFARDSFARLEWNTDPNRARRMRTWYQSVVRGVDLVMFAGGGIIEYSHNRYQDAIELIVREARRAGKPVVFCAVGLVGECDPKSLKFRTTRRALTSPNVKLNERYLQGFAKARLVADTAVWASEAYPAV